MRITYNAIVLAGGEADGNDAPQDLDFGATDALQTEPVVGGDEPFFADRGNRTYRGSWTTQRRHESASAAAQFLLTHVKLFTGTGGLAIRSEAVTSWTVDLDEAIDGTSGEAEGTLDLLKFLSGESLTTIGSGDDVEDALNAILVDATAVRTGTVITITPDTPASEWPVVEISAVESLAYQFDFNSGTEFYPFVQVQNGSFLSLPHAKVSVNCRQRGATSYVRYTFTGIAA